jgi:hypothetical protein
MISYNKVLTIGDPTIAELLKGEVIIEEKYDGSQFRITIDKNRRCLFGSKSVDYSDMRMPDQMFVPIIKKCEELITPKLDDIIASYGADSISIFGEYLSGPRHNTLKYQNVPNNNLVIFDVCITHNDGTRIWMTPDEKAALAEMLGFSYPHMLYSGDGSEVNMDLINKLLETESSLGGTRIEGVVIKNYGRYFDPVRYPYLTGYWLCGKYVREEFKELNRANWKDIRKPAEELIIESLHNENRWEKTYQHLRDSGELDHQPQDIPLIIKGVIEDIEEEEKENIKEQLYKNFRKKLNHTTEGLPEWYKKKLLEEGLK